MEINGKKTFLNDLVQIIESPGGYPLVKVVSAKAQATIAYLGATLMEWQPKDQEPVIFTSSQAEYREGKAIRGGVPVCWPWFGAHPTDSSKPNHGFVRNKFWQLDAVEEVDKVVRVTFVLPEQSHDLLDGLFELKMVYEIGSDLSCSLVTKNLGENPLVIGGALHTYFQVNSIQRTLVKGLVDTDYLDKVDGMSQQTQVDEITISGEVDRVYLETKATCQIVDEGHGRVINIAKEGSSTTVVWNPWIDKAADLEDLGDEDYLKFVCVETVNTGDDVVKLATGEIHALVQKVSIDLL